MLNTKISKIAYTSAMTLALLSPTVLNTTQVFAATDVPATESSSSSNQTPVTTQDSSSAESSAQQKSTKHTLSKPYVVYGSGVASDIKPSLDKVFKTDSNFETLTAGASDYNKYIDPNTNTTDGAMISSVAIAPGDPGSGVKVNIEKYDENNNITQVTAQQYAMVAQMAGVTDVNIIVTANRPVSGESALTGVYKALNTDGAHLNTENTSTANQMLDATQGAINDNKDDKSYPGKLMAAVGDVSKQLAEQKQDNQNLATKQDIQDMLNKALEKQGIDKQTTPEQIGNITNSLVSFQKAPISSDPNYKKNITNTIDNVKDSAGNMFDKAKGFMNSEDGKKAQGFLAKIWNSIKNFFSGFLGENKDNSNQQSSANESQTSESSDTTSTTSN